MKPATALPWSIVDDKEGPRTIILDAYRNEIAHDLPYEHFFNSDNADYIVHAANNYPRLVQALKDLEKFCHPVNTVYSWDENQRRAIGTARAILRELGETS